MDPKGGGKSMTTKTTYTEAYVLQVRKGSDWIDEHESQSLNGIENYELASQYFGPDGFKSIDPMRVTRIIKRTEIKDISEEEVDYF